LVEKFFSETKSDNFVFCNVVFSADKVAENKIITLCFGKEFFN